MSTDTTTQLMKNKRGIVFGVANDHSIAWGIAKKLSQQGADVALTYQNEGFLKRIAPLAAEINTDMIFPCDVGEEENIAQLFESVQQKWGKIDFIVHALAYADKNELKGQYINTSRKNFTDALIISCFSFTQIARFASQIMNENGSMLTLTFEGSQRVMPSYNVMGIAKAALESSVRYLASDLGPKNIRVNAISAGPMRTLSGAVIQGSRFVYNWHGTQAPLRRNVTLDDISGSALYLLSNLSQGVTGELLYVDSGFNNVGMITDPSRCSDIF